MINLSELIKHLDFSINIPTLIGLLTLLIKGLKELNRWRQVVTDAEYKLDSMWTEFLKAHPEYDRRSLVRD